MVHCYTMFYLHELVTIKVGCLGHVMPETIAKLSEICYLLKSSV